MMLRFIATLCVGTLLLMSVGLWFGTAGVSPELSTALQGVLSRGAETLRTAAALAPRHEVALEEPEPAPALQSPPAQPEERGEAAVAPQAPARSDPELVEIAETLPGWTVPFLESRDEETADASDPASGVAARSPDQEAWADRIRRMLAIYRRVGLEH